MVQAPVKNSILADYENRFPGSKALAGRARNAIAGGVVHDGRYFKPFPIYIDHAEGAYKWDVDGHRFIDYGMGHGALILGHNDPDVTAAVHEQLGRGTHHSQGHLREIEYAEQIQKLVPSAEQVRFTMSGTESTLLALRLMRAHTGKSKVIKFEGHFHGWNDYLLKGEKAPFATKTLPGVPPEVLETIEVLPANNIELVEQRLAKGDIAGVIIEPSGASWDTIPLVPEFLAQLREVTAAHHVVLTFDEVISGFRWAPGGAQQRYGVTPDMTTMAKIVAGGFPGGAVVGKTEVMQHMAFKDEPEWNTTKKVSQNGTFNANPITAAAGTACLRKIADGAVQEHCDALATRLRAGLNDAFERHSIPGCAWGESSVFHIMIGETVTDRIDGDLQVPTGVDAETLKISGHSGPMPSVYMAMLLEGMDLFHGGGMLSAAHTEEHVDITAAAFDRVLQRLREDGLVM